jgi:hypothetical protein
LAAKKRLLSDPAPSAKKTKFERQTLFNSPLLSVKIEPYRDSVYKEPAMTDSRLSRRAFLQGCSTAAAAGVLTPYFFTADAAEQDLPRSANDRFRIGAIGMRYQGSVVAEKTLPHGDIVAICDVDREIAEKAREQFGGRRICTRTTASCSTARTSRSSPSAARITGTRRW